MAMFSASASGEPNWSTCTEWSITRSTGTSGLIFFGSPPSRFIAPRMVARSSTHGTPVKSWSTTRASFKRDFDRRLPHGLPRRQPPHVVLGDLVAVAVAQDAFQQHADRIGQRRDVGQSGVFQLRKAIDSHPAGAGLERVTGMERIVHRWFRSILSRLRLRNERFSPSCEAASGYSWYSRKRLT